MDGGMIKQKNDRKAEKVLKEILAKADSKATGRVELKDFMDILEANGVEVRIKMQHLTEYLKNKYFQMDEADLADFTAMSDANGEIAKKDLIIFTKVSRFWHSYTEAKYKPDSPSSKVRKIKKA